MAKELIDLGTPGVPNTGDNLPAGGEKVNNHINAVYDAFSYRGQDPIDQTLHATGVYQFINTNTAEFIDPHYEYLASPGEMLMVDMEGEVHILLPDGDTSGAQVKITTSSSYTPTVRVYSVTGQINAQDFVILEPYIQYQFIAFLNPTDGQWSQRIINGSGGNTNSFNPGPIQNQFEEDFVNNRPSGTPVWRYWEINLEDLASASDQSFTLFFTELGFVVHAAKIMVAWGSSFTPVEYDLRTSVVSITSGADITTGIPFVSEQKYSDNQSDYLVLDLSSAADLDTCFSGHFTMRVAVLTSFPPELFQLD